MNEILNMSSVFFFSKFGKYMGGWLAKRDREREIDYQHLIKIKSQKFSDFFLHISDVFGQTQRTHQVILIKRMS